MIQKNKYKIISRLNDFKAFMISYANSNLCEDGFECLEDAFEVLHDNINKLIDFILDLDEE